MKIDALCVVALIHATLSFAQTTKSTEPAPDTLIALQRFACENRCAVYRLVIFADGSVIWEGRSFVKQRGLIRSGISPEALTRLIGDLEAGGFFELHENYGYGTDSGCASINPDGPAAILSVSNRGRSKTVLHHHRCVGPEPDRVTKLEDAVDRAVGTVKWIK